MCECSLLLAKTIGTYDWADLFELENSNFGKAPSDPEYFDTDKKCFPSNRSAGIDYKCCQDNAKQGPFHLYNENRMKCCPNGQVESLGEMC